MKYPRQKTRQTKKPPKILKITSQKKKKRKDLVKDKRKDFVKDVTK